MTFVAPISSSMFGSSISTRLFLLQCRGLVYIVTGAVGVCYVKIQKFYGTLLVSQLLHVVQIVDYLFALVCPRIICVQVPCS